MWTTAGQYALVWWLVGICFFTLIFYTARRHEQQHSFSSFFKSLMIIEHHKNTDVETTIYILQMWQALEPKLLLLEKKEFIFTAQKNKTFFKIKFGDGTVFFSSTDFNVLTFTTTVYKFQIIVCSVLLYKNRYIQSGLVDWPNTLHMIDHNEKNINKNLLNTNKNSTFNNNNNNNNEQVVDVKSNKW